jgi:hypothetical protein
MPWRKSEPGRRAFSTSVLSRGSSGDSIRHFLFLPFCQPPFGSRRLVPINRSLHQARLNWISLHISHGGNQMAFVHRIRVEALLSQMPPPPFAEINHPRISSMRLSKCSCQGSRLTGNHHKVSMIAHQTPCQDIESVFGSRSG